MVKLKKGAVFIYRPFALSSYSRLLYCDCEKYSTHVEVVSQMILKEEAGSR